MTYYHGSKGPSESYEGMCLTTDLAVAVTYAGKTGTVYEVEIAVDLRTCRCEGINEETGECDADDSDFRAECAADGYDVLTYADQDKRGCYHDCYRIISDRAVAACTMYELELV